MLIKVQYTKVGAGWKETTWGRAVLWASARGEVLEPPGLSGQGREGLLEHGERGLPGRSWGQPLATCRREQRNEDPTSPISCSLSS